MQFTTYVPAYVEPHDDDSLLYYEARPVAVPSKEALKKRRQRLRQRSEFSTLIESWLNEYYSDNERDLTLRDVLPVLAKYPKVLGELALFIRSGGNVGTATT